MELGPCIGCVCNTSLHPITNCQGVMDYLEDKRANFPRFYFLSNNEMVNLLVR
jgi:hypothetical protein